MPRFYHTDDALMGRSPGTVGMILPITDDDGEARLCLLTPLGFAPVATGTYGTFKISLSMEGR